MPKINEAIRLNLQLFDGGTTLYPLVYAYNAAGSQISGSPVALSHLANGLYTNSSLLMPDTAQVRAVYRVFTDSGHTLISDDYSDALDIFNLETDDVSQGELIGQIETGVTLFGILDINTEFLGTIDPC